MKKGLILSLCALLMFGSCGTGTHMEQGALNGGMFGAIFGSALGGVFGGPRGSDMGTMVGMLGGAMIGAQVGALLDVESAIGRNRHSADAGREDDAYGRSRASRRDSRNDDRTDGNDAQTGYDGNYAQDESGFDPTGSGDDRITFDDASSGGFTVGSYPPAANQPAAGGGTGELHIGGGNGTGHAPAAGVYTTVQPRTISVEQLAGLSSASGIKLNPMIEIRNASFVDADGDGIISRGEQCKVSFEIMNHSSETIRDIRPAVAETTGNKHIRVSPGLRVERIQPGRGVRYTAVVMADNRLKDGEAVIKVGVAQGDNEVASQVKEFCVQTRKAVQADSRHR